MRPSRLKCKRGNNDTGTGDVPCQTQERAAPHTSEATRVNLNRQTSCATRPPDATQSLRSKYMVFGLQAWLFDGCFEGFEEHSDGELQS
jgi:hypothetical protein